MTNSSKACSVLSCDKPVKSRDLCTSHYMNWWRRGDPLAFASVPSSLDRFMAKVTKDTAAADCWLWTGATVNGYGSVRINQRAQRAHRWLYEQTHGEIAASLDLDHLCRNRACVNPDHLEPVSRSENLTRGDGGCVSLVCRRGHWKLGDNLYILPGSGHRVCRACVELTRSVA